jgi:hypothetical protein
MKAVGVDHLRPVRRYAADLGDAAILDADIAGIGRGARAVDDGPAADDNVVDHGSSSPRATVLDPEVS